MKSWYGMCKFNELKNSTYHTTSTRGRAGDIQSGILVIQ